MQGGEGHDGLKPPFSSPQPAAAPVLTLYFRQGCHLCEDMERQLLALAEIEPFLIERVDVDSRPELTASFGHLIPVLALGDRIIR